MAVMVMVLTGAGRVAEGETTIPIPAEAQTSLSPRETYSEKTLIRMAYAGGANVEIPVFRYDLSALKGVKIVKAVMTLNVTKERLEDWTLTLRAIGGDTLIPWDPKTATLNGAGTKPGWPVGGFLKMQHGPDLGEGPLAKGTEDALVTFPFSEEGLAVLRDIADGKRPNNGFFIDLARLGNFQRVSFVSVHQRAILQPYLKVTVVEETKAAGAARFTWPGDAGSVECKVTSDTSICAHQDEELDNVGAKDKVRIKYIQHFWAGALDLSAAKGKEITAGLLMLKRAEGGESEALAMRKFWVSTVVSDFAEGKADDYGVQPLKMKDGVNYRFAGTDSQFWGRPRDPKDYAVDKITVPGKAGEPATTVMKPVKPNIFFDPERPGVDDFTDAVFGNGASRFHFASGVELNADGYYLIPIPGALLQSILLGEARGLVLYDGSGTALNYDVWSRESKFPPKLLVQVKAPTAAASAAPAGFRATAAGAHAPGLAFLEWTEGAGTFGYEIRVDGKAVPAWQGIACQGAGAKIRLPLDFLAAGARAIEVVPFNVTGQRGTAAKATVNMPAAAATVALVDAAKVPKARAEKPAGGDKPVRLWACDELGMVDPQTGKRFHTGDDSYKLGNSVWDGQTVRLVSARDSVVCFQLILEPDKARGITGVPDISLSLSDFKAETGGKLKVTRLARFYTAWYHETAGLKGPDGKSRWLADALIPVDPDRAPAFPNGRVPEQANQAFFVDIHIPAYALAGEYTADLTVSTAVSDDVIPVRLKVYDVTLPQKMTFRHELNLYPGGIVGGTGIDGYANPEAAGATVQTLHQLARFHRLVVNMLPYSQTGRTSPVLTPPIAGVGKATKVTDWSLYDKTVGPLATGKAFTPEAGYYGPLSGVPEAHLYLPMHETWPADMSQFCANHPAKDPALEKLDIKTAEGKKAARDLFKQKLFPTYRMNCNGPEEDLGAFFQEANVSIAGQFAEHFAAKGWTNTFWQFYLNNKPGFGNATLYTLDEPITELDFRALNFFLTLWKRGVQESKAGDKVRFEYRGDISRPQWQFSFLDNGAMNLHCISAAFFTKNYKVRTRAQRFGWETWLYGGGPNEFGNTLALYGACVNSWSLGADGILPYYTGLNSKLGTFDDLAMLYRCTAAEAASVGLKVAPQKVTGMNLKNIPEEFSYVGPFPSTRLLVARSAVQDIEAMNALAEKMGVHRDVLRKSLRASLDLSMHIESTNPDDPGSSVFTALNAPSIAALRETVLEKLAAAGKK